MVGTRTQRTRNSRDYNPSSTALPRQDRLTGTLMVISATARSPPLIAVTMRQKATPMPLRARYLMDGAPLNSDSEEGGDINTITRFKLMMFSRQSLSRTNSSTRSSPPEVLLPPISWALSRTCSDPTLLTSRSDHPMGPKRHLQPATRILVDLVKTSR
jgi:hypothetical protein